MLDDTYQIPVIWVGIFSVLVQEADEVLSVYILLTLAWPCQRPQCHRPMGMAKPSLIRLREMTKPSPCPELQLPPALS